MLPDKNGILRPHHVQEDTVKHFHTVVDAEERMDAVALSQSTAVPQSRLMPSTSLSSVPSTSSLQSSTASLHLHINAAATAHDR